MGKDDQQSYSKTPFKRRMLFGLAALVVTGFVTASAACAQAVTADDTKAVKTLTLPPNTIVISSKDAVYPLNNVMQVIEVPRQPIPSFTQAMQRFKGNQGKPVSGHTVSLGYGRNGYWILFNAYNRSQAKTSWTLDFGGLEQGTVGIADRVAIYTNAQPEQPVMVEGRMAAYKIQVNGQHKNAVPVTIDTGENRIIGIYVEPAAGVPVTMNMQLIEQSLFVSNHEQDGMKESIFFILASLAVIGFFFKWRATGFKKHIPAHLAVYTAATCLAYAAADDLIPLQGRFRAEYLDIIKAAACYSAVALSHQVLVAGGRGNRFGLSVASFKFAIAGLALFAFFAGNYIAFPGLLLNSAVPLATTVFIVIMGVMTATQTSRPQAITYTAGWALLLFGALVSQVAMLGVLGSKPGLISLYWTLIIPHLAVISFAALRFLSVSENMILQERLSLKQKQEDEAEMRKTREMADQSRLFSIMQREKELMADLRNRESERAQAMRKAKDIADQANKAKSDFLAVISHEIRTPMTGIMGMIRLMLDTPLNERQKEFARTIQYSGETLLTLLNDILDLSKAEEGKMSIEVIDFDIVRLTQSVAMLMSGRADEKKIYIKADIDPEVPKALKGDPTRLRQILLNLVGNAIKFTEQGGVTITIKLQEKSPGKKPRIYFGVSDTGIGIPEDAQKKLFQPYAQADASTARKFGGTGLGLSICKKLVEAMGSTIQIRSKPGEGTTFYYILSLDYGEVKEEEQETKSDGKINGEDIIPLKILVVDDNNVNQRVVAGLLEKDKHTIKTVGSAKESFAAIEETTFDVILMDMEMPEIDGIEATKIIREMKDPAKASQIIIAMTGNTSKEDIERCKQAGMNDYLSKPINPDIMRKVLNVYGKKKAAGDHAAPAAAAVAPAATAPAAPAPQKQADDKQAATPAAPSKSAAAGGYVPVPPPAKEAAPLQATKPAIPPAGGAGGYVPVPPPAKEKENTAGGYVPVPPPAAPAAGGYVPVPPPVKAEPHAGYTPVPPPAPTPATPGGYVPVPPPVKEAAPAYTPAPPPVKEEAAGYTPVPPPKTAPAQASEKPLFDQDTLGTLKDSLGAPGMIEMMEGLYQKTEELITAAEKAIIEKDYSALIGRGHDIKGMTANFGITVLSQLGGRLEREAKDRISIEDLREIVVEMRPTYDKTRKALDEWMKS